MKYNILIFLFAIRPIIDLAWEQTLFLGMNLAGLIAVIIILLTIIYGLENRIKFCNKSICTGLLFASYITIITTLHCTQLSDFNYSIRLFSELSFLLVVAPNMSLNSLNKLMAWFLVATLVPIILTYGQVAGVIEYTYFDYVDGSQISRGSGGYRQPSVLTRFCSLGLLYAFYLLEIVPKSSKTKLYLYVYMVLNLIAVIFSYHRTGIFLVFFLTALWFFLKEKKKVTNLAFKIGFRVIVAFIIFFLLYKINLIVVDLSVLQSMLSLENVIAIGASGNYQLTLRGRGEILLLLLNGLLNNPWYYTLFGNGVAENVVTHIEIETADMELIRVLWNGGFVGCFLWLLHFVIINRCIARWRREQRIRRFYRLATCVFWCFIIWGLCIEATESPNLMYHVYLICGWCCFKKNVMKNIEEIKT